MKEQNLGDLIYKIHINRGYHQYYFPMIEIDTPKDKNDTITDFMRNSWNDSIVNYMNQIMEWDNKLE